MTRAAPMRNDCGPACLHYVARHLGLRLSGLETRVAAGTFGDGTTLAGMVEVGAAVGLRVAVLKGSASEALSLPRRSILRVRLPHDSSQHHFVVLLRVRRDRSVLVWDPAIRRSRRISHGAFVEYWGDYALIVANLRTENSPPSGGALLWELIKPNFHHYAEALVGSLLVALLGFCLSFYVRMAMDNVVPNRDWQLLNLGGITVACALFLRAWLLNLSTRMVESISQGVAGDLALAAYRNTITAKQAVFDVVTLGEMHDKLFELSTLQKALGEIVIRTALNAILIFSTVGLLWYINVTVALVFAGAAILVVLLTLAADLVLQHRQSALNAVDHKLDGVIAEFCAVPGTVKRLGLEDHTISRMTNGFRKQQAVMEATNLANASRSNFGDLSGKLVGLAVLWTAVAGALKSTMSAGDIIFCFILASVAAAPIASLATARATWQNIHAVLDRAGELLRLPQDDFQSGKQPFPKAPSALDFRGVSFGFPGRRRIFTDMDATLQCGAIHLITGPSGSGKSTLLSLISRLYEPESGSFLVGGIEATEIALKDLRLSVGSVPQKIELFAGTLLYNLNLGDDTIDQHHIVRRCADFGLSDLLCTGSNPLSFRVEEGGKNLSGGQRQKVGLLRVLLRNPSILCLDEPETGLDLDSQEQLRKELLAYRSRGGTVLLVSHSSLFASWVDRRWVVTQGRLESSA